MPYRPDVISASSSTWLRDRLAVHLAYADRPTVPDRIRAMHAADAASIRAELSRRAAGGRPAAPRPDLISPASVEERAPRGHGREVDQPAELARP